MIDAPSKKELLLFRLAAAGDENERLATLLRACGLAVTSIADELQTFHGWRDVEVAIALSEMLDQIKAQIVEEVFS